MTIEIPDEVMIAGFWPALFFLVSICVIFVVSLLKGLWR